MNAYEFCIRIAWYCRLADGGGGRGNVIHHVKKEEKLSGRGKCPRELRPGGKCTDPD